MQGNQHLHVQAAIVGILSFTSASVTHPFLSLSFSSLVRKQFIAKKLNLNNNSDKQLLRNTNPALA